MVNNETKNKTKMEKEEAITLVDSFINSIGKWNEFVSFIEDQGYTIEELGFEE